MHITLFVEKFGVKYVGEEHAQHLKETLETDYKVTTEWDGRRYIENYVGLGLQKTAGPPINARIHQESTQTIST